MLTVLNEKTKCRYTFTVGLEVFTGMACRGCFKEKANLALREEFTSLVISFRHGKTKAVKEGASGSLE
jgi:hypothetical protein